MRTYTGWAQYCMRWQPTSNRFVWKINQRQIQYSVQYEYYNVQSRVHAFMHVRDHKLQRWMLSRMHHAALWMVLLLRVRPEATLIAHYTSLTHACMQTSPIDISMYSACSTTLVYSNFKLWNWLQLRQSLSLHAHSVIDEVTVVVWYSF